MVATSDITYPLFPIFAFLGFFLPLIPLAWHLQAWNSGTCYYMIWASVACLNQFVNSVVWAGNASNVAPIWCDISIRIIMGASVGLPAASLCINRRLYHIATTQAVTVTRADKSRAVLVDSLICVLFPLVFVALQYIVQGHRFNIFEDIGCYPALYNTIPVYFLSTMWPIVLGLISACYCVLSLRAFIRRRVQFNQFLSSNKSITVSRYFRLMALSMTEILCTTPLSILMIWVNTVATPISPWISFADTHFDFSRVQEIPSVVWRQNHLLVLGMEFTRWVTPLCGLVFFAYFGFAEEAKKNYRAAFWAVAGRFGFKPKQSSSKQSFVLPTSVGKYRQPPPSQIVSLPSLPPYSPSSTCFTPHDFKPSEPLTPGTAHSMSELITNNTNSACCADSTRNSVHSTFCDHTTASAGSECSSPFSRVSHDYDRFSDGASLAGPRAL